MSDVSELIPSTAGLYDLLLFPTLTTLYNLIDKPLLFLLFIFLFEVFRLVLLVTYHSYSSCRRAQTCSAIDSHASGQGRTPIQR